MSAGPDEIAAIDVERAAAGLGGRVHRTPLFTSASLAAVAGLPVVLKAELFQRTGSFKPRGAFTRLDALTPAERRRGVITVSAGNHAAALAYAAAREGIDCLVLMTRTASALKAAAAAGYGATLDREAEDPTALFARLDEVRGDRMLVHPFDDPLVLAGQGTVGREIIEDAPSVDVIVVPVGGGGLVAGIAAACAAARPAIRVVAVEPEGSAALGVALAAGAPVPLTPRSLADGLNAPFAGDLPLAVCRALGVEHVTVTEAEIRAGFRFLYERAKLAAEPAGAVGVAALLARRIPLDDASTVAVVVSGGNVEPEIASDILTSDEG
jgi:threonine dehydratase